MTSVTFRDFDPQGEEIRALQNQLETDRLPHAIMITGEEGAGKKTLAALLSKGLLCRAEKDRPCGKCGGCQRAEAGEHPDQIWIRKGVPLSPDTKKDRATIPVEDIREMIRLCGAHPFEGGRRAVIIADAENMTPQAQNSLLKTLEEPPVSTTFILTVSHREMMLDTILSRCRTVRLHPWDEGTIRAILLREGVGEERAALSAGQSNGSIGMAQKIARDEEYWKTRQEILDAFLATSRRSDILRISGAWKDRKGDAATLFAVLEGTVRQMVRYRYRQVGGDAIRQLPEPWQRMAARAGGEVFSRLGDMIRQARKETLSSVNFQAVFEKLLMGFVGEGVQW